MEEYGLRLEDYGRQAMVSLSRLSAEKISEGFRCYLEKLSHVKYFMILSNKVGYYSVFKVESENIEDKIKNIISFLNESRYYNIDGADIPYVEMIDVRHYEINEEHGHLELWIGHEYFQFFPFDWGIEIVWKPWQ